MATALSTALKSCIEDNWSAETGGTEPTVYGTDHTTWPTKDEWIRILGWTWSMGGWKRHNTSYVGYYEQITIEVSTKNHADGEDRLEEMVNEIKRIVTPSTLTGFVFVDIVGRDRSPSAQRDGVNIWAEQMTIRATIPSTSSAITPGSTTDNTLGNLLMYGAANAAWVPCMYMIDSTDGLKRMQVDSASGYLSNFDGTDLSLRWDLPLPTTKGSLKLYVKASRVVVNDADAAAYVNATTVYGLTKTGVTSLNADTTDYNSQDNWDDTFTAVDCSGYNSVFVWLAIVVDALDELKIGGVYLQCYYDT